MQDINCPTLELRVIFLAFGIYCLLSIAPKSLHRRWPFTQREERHAETGITALGFMQPLVLQDAKSSKVSEEKLREVTCDVAYEPIRFEHLPFEIFRSKAKEYAYLIYRVISESRVSANK
jgi:hypothetical protein